MTDLEPLTISLFVLLQYYAESHALIYIVDSSDRERIPQSKETFGKLDLKKIAITLRKVFLDYVVLFHSMGRSKNFSRKGLLHTSVKVFPALPEDA